MGHGREAYFWALIASLGMFFTGALLSVHEGIDQLVHPTRVASVPVALIVLAVSFCLDGLSLVRAVRQLRREAATRTASSSSIWTSRPTRSPARRSPRTRWRWRATCWRRPASRCTR